MIVKQKTLERNRIKRWIKQMHAKPLRELPFLSASAGSDADPASPTTQSSYKDYVLKWRI